MDVHVMYTTGRQVNFLDDVRTRHILTPFLGFSFSSVKEGLICEEIESHKTRRKIKDKILQFAETEIEVYIVDPNV